MSVQCLPPYTPLLFSKTAVWKGIHIFHSFAPERGLWVLVGTASPRRFLRVPAVGVLGKQNNKKKNVIFFQ